MPIISQNQTVDALISLKSGLLDIDFGDNPAFALSESVIIDLPQRSIGIIYQHAYHYVAAWPEGFSSYDSLDVTYARLHGSGEKGREIQLCAPVRFVSDSGGEHYV